MAADTPHFAYPFALVGAHVATVEQDTEEHLMTCANHVARCPTGFRDERPDFGWSFPEFRTAPLDPEGLVVALERFGPAARFTATEVADAADATTRRITIEMGMT